jgi:signal transduction histidine kinase
LCDRIAALAELGNRTLAAERCVIAFRLSAASADDVVAAPAKDSRWDKVLNQLLAALDHRLTDAVAAGIVRRTDVESIERVALSPREIDALAPAKSIDGKHQLAASVFTEGEHTVRIALVASADRPHAELNASLEFLARAVFGELALTTARASLEFWRNHGAESGRQAVGARRDLGRQRTASNLLDDAVAAVRSARPAERFGCFGGLVADGAGFDQWMVAVADAGSFVVAASSSGRTQFDLGEASAMAESFRRRIVIARWRDREESAVRASRYFEDKIFADSYVCLPFDTGAIALGSRDARASAANAEAIVARLAPFVGGWLMEREASRRSVLMRHLALRMFAAVDEERSRIARDLHDNQAQLLAAAKIALAGKRDAAREIFKQIESELRRKTRELRPPTLGSASLDDAIHGEFALLERAGVTAKLIHGGTAEKLSHPVQQLCFQIVRETLSNVIRHAHAKSVQITLEKIETVARVWVVDDGCGIAANHSDGIGLAGVRERLELMGGRLRVESRAGRTAVFAEIPEPA